MLCGKCRKETRVPGQRWGRACFNAYMRAYRSKTKAQQITESPLHSSLS